MRLAPLILVLLSTTCLPAGFSVTYSSIESTSTYQAASEAAVAAIAELTSKELQESLARRAAPLPHDEAEIMDGAVCDLSAPTALALTSVSDCCCNMHFNLTAPISDRTVVPDQLRLDILFDVNGVPMGDLSSVSGMPIGYARSGIVRIDGISGTQLVQHFGRAPHISLLSSGPAIQEIGVTVVEEIACLLFVAAAFLSAIGQRRQQERQLEAKRRQLRNMMLAAANDLKRKPA